MSVPIQRNFDFSQYFDFTQAYRNSDINILLNSAI